MLNLLSRLKGTMLHPQWLTDRYHRRSRRCLRDLRDALVLDIGSGNSRTAELIHPSCTLYRLDYPVTGHRYCFLPDVYGDVADLPIAASSIDIVLLFEVLEHVVDDDRALREIARVLKPTGRLYLSVPFIYPIHDAPYDFRRYTVYGLKALLEKRNFRLVKLIVHGNSLVVAMQLFNLVLLECVYNIFARLRWMGRLLGMLIYPVCLAINLIAWPLTWVSSPRAACFGYFAIAEHR